MLTQGLDLRAVLAYGTGAMQPIGLTTGAAASQQSMFLPRHTCALLDVASEVVSEIESEMELEAPRRKPSSRRFSMLAICSNLLETSNFQCSRLRPTRLRYSAIVWKEQGPYGPDSEKVHKGRQTHILLAVGLSLGHGHGLLELEFLVVAQGLGLGDGLHWDCFLLVWDLLVWDLDWLVDAFFWRFSP